jgi:hypothetical protein
MAGIPAGVRALYIYHYLANRSAQKDDLYICLILGCPFRLVSTFLHTGGVCLHIHTGGLWGGWGYEFKDWMHEIEIEWGVIGIEWGVGRCRNRNVENER